METFKSSQSSARNQFDQYLGKENKICEMHEDFNEIDKIENYKNHTFQKFKQITNIHL